MEVRKSQSPTPPSLLPHSMTFTICFLRSGHCRGLQLGTASSYADCETDAWFQFLWAFGENRRPCCPSMQAKASWENRATGAENILDVCRSSLLGMMAWSLRDVRSLGGYCLSASEFCALSEETSPALSSTCDAVNHLPVVSPTFLLPLPLCHGPAHHALLFSPQVPVLCSGSGTKAALEAQLVRLASAP